MGPGRRHPGGPDAGPLGLKQLLIGSTQYFSGDISSHVFDVPLRADITNKSGSMMPIPYTNKCGVCHTAAP